MNTPDLIAELQQPLDTSALTRVLIEADRELNERFARIEGRLAAVEARIAALEARHG